MRSCLLTLLTAVSLLGVAAASDDPTEDRENIQGTWQAVSAEDSGRKVPDEAVKNIKWVITEEKITQYVGDTKKACSYGLNVTKKPRWIDLTEIDRTTPGIYALNGDTLKICFPEGGKGERPTAFESKPNSANDIVIILKREQP